MSDNDRTIDDGLGKTSDWIELYNQGDSTVNLGVYYLSDDFDTLFKWRLPMRPTGRLKTFTVKSTYWQVRRPLCKMSVMNWLAEYRGRNENYYSIEK